MKRLLCIVGLLCVVVSFGQTQGRSDDKWDEWRDTCTRPHYLHPGTEIPQYVSGAAVAAVIPDNILLSKSVWKDTRGRETEGKMINFGVDFIPVQRVWGVVQVYDKPYRQLSTDHKLFVEKVTGLDAKAIEKLGVALRGKPKRFFYDCVVLAVKGKNNIGGTQLDFKGMEGLKNVFEIPVSFLELRHEEADGINKCRDALMEVVKEAIRNRVRNARRVEDVFPQPANNARPAHNARPGNTVCEICKGTGYTNNSCRQCKGTGHQDGDFTKPACGLCRGKGFGPCMNCGGTGKHSN